MLSDAEFLSKDTLLKLPKIVMTSVLILLVATPEGMPHGVSIVVAGAISTLKKEAVLVRNPGALEACAMSHDVLVGKSTLSSAETSVAKYHITDAPRGTDNEGNHF